MVSASNQKHLIFYLLIAVVGLASESRNPNFPAYIIQSTVPSRNSVSGWPAKNDFANSPWERGMLCFTWPAFFYKLVVLEAIGTFVVALGILHLCGICCSVFHIHTFICVTTLLCWNSFGYFGRCFHIMSCLVEVWLLKTICVPQEPFVIEGGGLACRDGSVCLEV